MEFDIFDKMILLISRKFKKMEWEKSYEALHSSVPGYNIILQEHSLCVWSLSGDGFSCRITAKEYPAIISLYHKVLRFLELGDKKYAEMKDNIKKVLTQLGDIYAEFEND